VANDALTLIWTRESHLLEDERRPIEAMPRLLSLPRKLFVVREFNEQRKKVHSINEALAFAFDFQYHDVTIRPLQVKEEISSLVKKLQDTSPRVLLEIGTSHGGSLYLFCMAASPDAVLISVDLRGGKYGGGYSRLRVPLYRSFARERQEIHLINGNSHEHSTLAKVKDILDGKQVDFLFIDGDHSYEGVKADFDMYSGLVRNGGIIALHDIVEHTVDRSVEVPKLWNEIKSKYEHEEMVKDWNQGWGGIGVIYRKS
jgi:cephalosporin hydroxylase